MAGLLRLATIPILIGILSALLTRPAPGAVAMGAATLPNDEWTGATELPLTAELSDSLVGATVSPVRRPRAVSGWCRR